MTIMREVVEGLQSQAVGTSRRYAIDWQRNGVPSSPTLTIKDAWGRDKSISCLSDVASVVGTVVVTPFVTGLIKDQIYRLECLVTIGGNTYKSFLRIVAEE